MSSLAERLAAKKAAAKKPAGTLPAATKSGAKPGPKECLFGDGCGSYVCRSHPDDFVRKEEAVKTFRLKFPEKVPAEEVAEAKWIAWREREALKSPEVREAERIAKEERKKAAEEKEKKKEGPVGEKKFRRPREPLVEGEKSKPTGGPRKPRTDGERRPRKEGDRRGGKKAAPKPSPPVVPTVPTTLTEILPTLSGESKELTRLLALHLAKMENTILRVDGILPETAAKAKEYRESFISSLVTMIEGSGKSFETVIRAPGSTPVGEVPVEPPVPIAGSTPVGEVPEPPDTEETGSGSYEEEDVSSDEEGASGEEKDKKDE